MGNRESRKTGNLNENTCITPDMGADQATETEMDHKVKIALSLIAVNLGAINKTKSTDDENLKEKARKMLGKIERLNQSGKISKSFLSEVFLLSDSLRNLSNVRISSTKSHEGIDWVKKSHELLDKYMNLIA